MVLEVKENKVYYMKHLKHYAWFLVCDISKYKIVKIM